MERRRICRRTSFKTWRLSQKMAAAVALLLLCSNLIVLCSVTAMAVRALKRESYEQLRGQLELALSAVAGGAEDMGKLMSNLAGTAAIQDFVSGGRLTPEAYLQSVNEIHESLQVLLRANNLVDYAALIPVGGGEYLYNGATLPCREVPQLLLENYAASEPFDSSGLRGALFQGVYFQAKWNLFCPVYERYSVSGEDPAAILVIGFDTGKMARYLATERENFEIRLLTKEGTVLVSAREEEIGTRAPWFDQYGEKYGYLSTEEQLLTYCRDDGGFWVADGMIAQSVIYAGFAPTVLLIALVIVLCTGLAIAVSVFFCRRFYAPMREIVLHMREVTGGKLDTQMPAYAEEDFRELSEGFNTMTGSVQNLIAEVQRQEVKMTEIRLNALQSQIKPHFLYNTLECIHWQALISHNEEIARLVMALSKFYRLCLSKGQDIVPLSQELAHTENYVVIQNMRFDNVVALQEEIPQELMGLELPKITLQPLVENAIYHGMKRKEEGRGTVWLRAREEKDCVLLLVEDDGVGMPEAELRHLNNTIGQVINDGSYGVKNVHQRIEIRYGKGYGLTYRRNEMGGVTAEIRLPLPEKREEETPDV